MPRAFFAGLCEKEIRARSTQQLYTDIHIGECKCNLQTKANIYNVAAFVYAKFHWAAFIPT